MEQVLMDIAEIMDALGTARYFWAAAAIALLIAFLYSLRRSMEFRRLTGRLRTLYRTAQIASSALDPERVIAQTVQAVHEIMGYDRVAAFMLKDGRLVPTAWAGYLRPPLEFPVDRGILGRVARTAQPALVPLVGRDSEFVPIDRGTISQLVMPLLVENEMVGVLSVETASGSVLASGQVLREEDFELVSSLTAQLTVALANARRYERTREQSIRDGLTGLYNHAYFQERMREEFARSRRYQRPLALIMADLDNFKKLNDRYGHTEGDRFLRLFALIIREQMREVDLPTRYGGEEFAIILPEAGASEAVVVAERLRQALAARSLEVHGEPITITASFGVADGPEEGTTPLDLIRAADEALYQAKRQGKNQVRAARKQEPAGAVSP